MTNAQDKTCALIVAAGRGSRFGGDRPKQYTDLCGRAILAWTAEAFLTHPGVDLVRVVIHKDDFDLYEAAVQGLFGLLEPVFGGDTRQDSVRLGLESLRDTGAENVLIHDAARPFVPAPVISGVIEAIAPGVGALPALAVSDTLKRGEDGCITETISRDGLFRAGTPQGFLLSEISAAHKSFAGQELTDDAQLFERSGKVVRLTEGHENGFKITTQEDLMRAQQHLHANLSWRTGQGFDVHAFDDSKNSLTLCGVEISHSAGLKGHSDADVGLHALTDALLGAIGQGDIGEHFPPSDPQWKGVASDVFLKHASDLVSKAGGQIENVDVTLICETPKIGPHRDAMRARVAEILGLDVSRVSVKATTTEGLGFTGRKEGIAAQALAQIKI